MTKRILTLAIVAGNLMLVACSSEPSDLRPGAKVSLDVVPPGTRTTSNLDNAADNSEHDQKDEVMLNHDPGANQIEGKQPVTEKVLTNQADSVPNHE
jgi:hypothetical protein